MVVTKLVAVSFLSRGELLDPKKMRAWSNIPEPVITWLRGQERNLVVADNKVVGQFQKAKDVAVFKVLALGLCYLQALLLAYLI